MKNKIEYRSSHIYTTYDIEIPLAEIEKLANFDREYKSCKRSNTQDR